MLCFIMTVFNFYVLILHLCATIKVILLLLFIFIVILPVIIRSWGQDPATEDGVQRAGFPGRALRFHGGDGGEVLGR